MPGRALNWILNATFRANPRYELIPFDRIPPEQQHALEEIRRDPQSYGILRAHHGGLGDKVVSHDTARLFDSLLEPGCLSAETKATLSTRPQTVAELVLDGVLEIEREDKMFVFGADAYLMMYGQPPDPTIETKIARLSLEALKYAQSLEIDDSATLSAKLYFYNRLPITPRWQHALPNARAVADHLGITSRGPNKRLLDSFWVPGIPSVDDGWFTWQAGGNGSRQPHASATYKLYVSPQLDAMRDTYWATVEVLTRVQALSFKVGSDVYGLMRPDKLVAYFASLDALRDAADRLLDRLKGCPSHGVPFTAELGGEGLISWGVDPPSSAYRIPGQERESWRLWVTNRLAQALITARAGDVSALPPWHFALARLRLQGVDTNTWALTTAIFQATSAEE